MMPSCPEGSDPLCPGKSALPPASALGNADLIQALPAAIYTCDADGYLETYNAAAVELWGRTPVAGKDRWCGSGRVFLPDGTPLPMDECPMAKTIRDRKPVRGCEIIIEREDGTRRHVIPYPELILDGAGRLVGAVNMLVDITDRKKAAEEQKRTEEALRVTGQQFRTLVMNSPVAIFTKDGGGRYTLANPVACEALGRPEGVEGLTDHDLIPKELADILRAHDLEVIRGGRAVELEEWVNDRHFLSSKFPLPDTAGNPAGIGGVSVDITTRSEVEKLLRESEAKFRSLANHAPVGIFLSAANGDALFVNRSWSEMSGMDAGEALGSGWMKALHPEDRTRVTGGWDAAVKAHSSSDSEFRFLKPDGSITWIQGSALQLRDASGEPAGYIGSCVDITGRKRSEQELAALTAESDRKRRLYEGLLSTTPDLAYVFGRDHRFAYANEALLALWGKTWEESIGKTCLELGYEPWHAEMHDREIEEVIATKRPVRGEVPFDGTGGRRIYDYILTPVLGADGEVEVIAGITRDVTERKHAEERADFLSELTGRLAPLSKEKEIIAVAVEAVGTRLAAHRCYFVECTPEDDLVVVKDNWVRDDAANIAGTYRLHEFGGLDWWKEYSAGEFSVEDVRTNSFTRESSKPYLDLGILSYAVQPFHADERRTVALAVTSDQPRRWSIDELALLEHVVARVWPLVERVRSEAALRESRRQQRLVSNHVPALISYLDRDEVFRFANGRYQEWFGIKPSALRGKSLRELYDEDTYQHRAPYIARVLEGHPVKFEGLTHHRELGWRDLEVSYMPDFGPDRQVRGFYVMALDITERKKSEKLLERQARRLRLLWEAAGIILSSEDPDLMLQRVFGKISALLEVDTFFNFMVNEAGDALQLLSCQGISDEDRAKITRLEFGQAVCGTVAQSRRAMVACAIQESDNPLVQLVKGFGLRAYACNPLMAGDELLGTLSFASRTRDHFEQDELEFMETICHYVTGAYVRLRLVESLRAGDRKKDEFLATLAHELRNPLAPIRTGLEIMKMAEGNPSAMEKVRATMERQVEQLVMLVNDLLDVSRITRGKMQLRTSRVDLAEVIRSATEASNPTISEAGHHLSVRLPDSPVYLEADPHRLAQVISNWLNTAAKYTARGGSISLEALPDPSGVVVRVSDNGIGIPVSMLERIFEMFTQVDSPADADYGGLGIGLTLVKSLVEMHGGRIKAESAGPGQGSSFSFQLPVLAAPDPGSLSGSPQSATTGAARRKVLVVDDNKAAADTLAMAVEMMGHEVRVASNGQEGVELASRFLPAVVLMDLGMPVMDGWEAARQIRGREWGKDIVLIALTGWGQEEDRRKTKEAGFDHHLVKPASPATIRELLDVGASQQA